MPTYRAGLVGSGGLCELHVAAVKALSGVQLVGMTDLDAEQATTTAETWGTQAFADLDALVAAGANVIHVVAPSSSHAAVTRAALERGCHVLVETPLTEDADEARALQTLADEQGLTISVNHSLRHDPQVTRALGLVRAGKLGDIVSVDILCGAEYPPYEGGRLPPWYRDAGSPFRDVGVHGLYLIQELLGPIEGVEADWRSLGGDPNLAFDEWRAMVTCARGIGQFQLTWNVKPTQSQLIIHGTKGVLRVDLLAVFDGKQASRPLPEQAERLFDAVTSTRLVDIPRSIVRFARQQLQPNQGLRDVVRDFYARLATGEAPPVTAQDAANVVDWVERIAREPAADHEANLARFTLSQDVPYLVTGAAGSLGKAVVAKLRADGHRVRVLQRRIPTQPQAGIEYAVGNLGDPEAVDRAVAGAQIVIHCGAATKGGWPEHKVGTVVGTQNVIDACKAHGVKQLVHISSMSVIDWAGMSGKGDVDESVALEPRADERGAYTRAKLEAEQLVTTAAKQGLPAVILRPGQIFGGGIPLVNGAVARNAAGRWLILGDGKLELPLVYIDDVVDAIQAAVDKHLIGGEVIHVIDSQRLDQRDVLDLAGGGKPLLRIPRAIVFALGRLSEIPLGLIGKRSPFGVYRLESALARLRYRSDRARELLGWVPRVGVREGIRRVTGEANVIKMREWSASHSSQPSSPRPQASPTLKQQSL